MGRPGGSIHGTGWLGGASRRGGPVRRHGAGVHFKPADQELRRPGRTSGGPGPLRAPDSGCHDRYRPTARTPPAGGGRCHRWSAVIEQPTLPADAVSTRLRRAYGFEEVALVPGAVTVDPAEVELGTEIAGQRLEMPFIAAAMDAVVDADFAVRMS